MKFVKKSLLGALLAATGLACGGDIITEFKQAGLAFSGYPAIAEAALMALDAPRAAALRDLKSRFSIPVLKKAHSLSLYALRQDLGANILEEVKFIPNRYANRESVAKLWENGFIIRRGFPYNYDKNICNFFLASAETGIVGSRFLPRHHDGWVIQSRLFSDPVRGVAVLAYNVMGFPKCFYITIKRSDGGILEKSSIGISNIDIENVDQILELSFVIGGGLGKINVKVVDGAEDECKCKREYEDINLFGSTFPEAASASTSLEGAGIESDAEVMAAAGALASIFTAEYAAAAHKKLDLYKDSTLNLLPEVMMEADPTDGSILRAKPFGDKGYPYIQDVCTTEPFSLDRHTLILSNRLYTREIELPSPHTYIKEYKVFAKTDGDLMVIAYNVDNSTKCFFQIIRKRINSSENGLSSHRVGQTADYLDVSRIDRLSFMPGTEQLLIESAGRKMLCECNDYCLRTIEIIHAMNRTHDATVEVYLKNMTYRELGNLIAARLGVDVARLRLIIRDAIFNHEPDQLISTKSLKLLESTRDFLKPAFRIKYLITGGQPSSAGSGETE